MFSGYKTYIVAAVAIVGAAAAWAVGDMTIADAAQIVVTSLLGMFIRAGVKTEVAKAP